jgi:hypothetical protein
MTLNVNIVLIVQRSLSTKLHDKTLNTYKENIMKKLFVSLLLVGATLPALAQHHGHGIRYNHYHHGYHRGNNWVAPLVIGGVVGYVLTRPDPVIVQQPVIIQPPMHIPMGQNCSPWTETQQADGTITRTRTCTQ